VEAKCKIGFALGWMLDIPRSHDFVAHDFVARLLDGLRWRVV
jgi:hypothetical protein